MMLDRQKGDTLIEVLMSMVVLSAVIIGATMIMSHGMLATQAATEHTQVSYQASQQTEMLRYLRDGYIQSSTGTLGTSWLNMVNTYADTNSSTFGSCAVSAGKNPFYLDPNDLANIVKSYSTASMPITSATAGKGLWVEATKSNNASPAYVDFQVQACWSGPGSSGQQTTITTLRLYDPSR
ncbi:MAG TPA: type II secretion system protein [Patescibacteria group bacterium]|nr:type II secretion system protein [Patescibacteria group bacterium]